jgi:hypothetical protein
MVRATVPGNGQPPFGRQFSDWPTDTPEVLALRRPGACAGTSATAREPMRRLLLNVMNEGAPPGRG